MLKYDNIFLDVDFDVASIFIPVLDAKTAKINKTG
jgi:hypothetical protein